MAYIGQKPADKPLGASDITDGIISNSKLAQDIISAETELATAPADTDEFLISDAGTLKRIDASLVKSTPGMTLIKETNASNVSAVTFTHGTDSVVFDSTYKVYFLTFTNILLASDESLYLRVLSGGSVQSGSTAYWTGQYGTYGSPALPNAYNDRYENGLWGSAGDVESTIPFAGYVYIYNVGQSSSYPQAMGQIFMQRSNGNPYGMGFSGYYKTAISNFDGITLTNDGGGNISSGNFKLYGIN